MSRVELVKVLVGLTSAPAAFMRLMSEAFQWYLNEFAINFIDVILVYSKSLEELEVYWRRVLGKLQE